MPNKRTYADRREYMIKAVTLFRQRIKAKSVEYKGGKCKKCGYNRSIRALSFHHLDPTEKDFTISDYSRSWERVKLELDKCILLCANCHMEIHDQNIAM